MPFVKGQSGNPSGKPRKGTTFSELFEKQLRKKVDVNGEKITYKELIVRRAILEAYKGDLRAIQFCVERLEGKPSQAINLKTSDSETASTSLNDYDIRESLYQSGHEDDPQ